MKAGVNRIQFKKPDVESVALFLYLCSGLFAAFVRFVLVRFGLEEGFVKEAILLIVACFPIIYYLFGTIGVRGGPTAKAKIRFTVLYLLVVGCGFISFALNNNLGSFYFREQYGIMPVFRPDGPLFAFLFFSSFDDPKKLKEVLLKSAYVLLFYQVVMVFLPAWTRGYWIDTQYDGSEFHARYSLSFGYNMLFLMMIFLSAGLKKKKWLHAALALVCGILIITNGGRGAIVAFALYLFLLLVTKLFDRETPKKQRKAILAFVLVLGILFLLRDTIATALLDFLSRNNISSRNLEMILNGSFSASNGRDRIWEAVIEAIRQGGLFGYGLFGDRPFVSPLHVAGYSHNLFLELIVSFGVFGVLAIIYIIQDIVRMLFFCKDREWKMIYIILIVGSFKLMLSFSLWYVWEFWAAAAVAIQCRSKTKKRLIFGMTPLKYRQ